MSSSEQFADRVSDDLAGLAASVMAALGDRLNLFKELAAAPATSADLSRRAGIDERYAREWLRGMCAAGYLERLADEVYRLTPAHVPVLADESSAAFVGGTLAFATELLSQIPKLEAAFRSGAGMAYETYRPEVFVELERDMASIYRARLTSEWLQLVPEVVRRLESGATVADVGTGGGLIPVLLAGAFRRSDFYGYDIHGPSIERARGRAADAGLTDRVHFEVADPSRGLPRSFDVVTTFDVLHDSAAPEVLLKSIHEAVAPAGVYLCFEQSVPPLESHGRPVEVSRYAFSLLYCMSVSLASGGAGLGTLGLDAATFEAYCRDAGFKKVERHDLPPGLHSLYLVLP